MPPLSKQVEAAAGRYCKQIKKKKGGSEEPPLSADLLLPASRSVLPTLERFG
jgi:hypothetical protein